MRNKIHTDNGSHIAALYGYHGNLDSFVPVIRGPVQDESKYCDEDDAKIMRRIESGAREVA